MSFNLGKQYVIFMESYGMHLNVLALQGVQEADREEDGFCIRSGITIILEKATIKDGTVI